MINNLKLMFLFPIMVCFYSCAEFQYSARRKSQTYSVQNCKEIYGKWEGSGKKRNIKNGEQEYKPVVWIFNEDGTLVIDDLIETFKIEDDCSKLIIGNDSNFYEITQTNDRLSLYRFEICLGPKIESGTIILKKIN